MQKPILPGAPEGVEYLTRHAQYREALREPCLETPVREELQMWKKALPKLRQRQWMRPGFPAPLGGVGRGHLGK